MSNLCLVHGVDTSHTLVLNFTLSHSLTITSLRWQPSLFSLFDRHLSNVETAIK